MNRLSPLLAPFILAGCSSLSAAGKNACVTNADCLDGRTCVDNVCVQPDGPDGATPPDEGGADSHVAADGDADAARAADTNDDDGGAAVDGDSTADGGADAAPSADADHDDGDAAGDSDSTADGGVDAAPSADANDEDGGDSSTVSCDPIFVAEASTASDATGASWATAFPKLQDALAVAGPRVAQHQCDRVPIWVAQGIYLPGVDRDQSFVLDEGVEIYGGFAGTETALAQRDFAAHPTILSGDLNGDDAPLSPGEDNAYHVVMSGAAHARLDGVIVEGGNANGASPDNLGGGIYLTNSGASLANLNVRGCLALNGGAAVYTQGGTVSILGSQFNSNNKAQGGADVYGGALYAEATNLWIKNSKFYDNWAIATHFAYGGAAYLTGSATVHISGTEFNDGDATTIDGAGTVGASGGGVFSEVGVLSITSCTFWENTVYTGGTVARGGGLLVAGGSAVVANTTFQSNGAGFTSNTPGDGSEVYLQGGTLVLVNDSLSTPHLTTDLGCCGPAVYGPATVTNSVIWEGDALPFSGGASVTYSCVEYGGYNEMDSSQTNRDDCLTSGGALTSGSPGIDKGNTAALPADVDDLDGDGDVSEPLPLDAAGHNRVMGGAVDMGAYEIQ